MRANDSYPDTLDYDVLEAVNLDFFPIAKTDFPTRVCLSYWLPNAENSSGFMPFKKTVQFELKGKPVLLEFEIGPTIAFSSLIDYKDIHIVVWFHAFQEISNNSYMDQFTP